MADGSFPPNPAADVSMDALLATKLYIPRPAAARLRRPRLLDLVSRGLQGPLTFLAAPTGWGKTTLLSGWCADAAGPAVSVAWLSLDAHDNDPVRFWTYVIAALQTVRPTIGAAQQLLRSPRSPPLDAVVIAILNELASLPGDVVLVLDDYHLIEQTAIHQSMAFFLDRLPPQAHLALLTRADPLLPLARWRARGAMVELRAAELRFTPEEASALLNQALGFSLDPGTIAALEARTEGWAAGLQLAALALRDRSDLTSFVGSFSGSHRFVADYLAEEVVDRQPAQTQEFLLRTSILERMCAPLCQALGDDTELRDAQRQLEQLERANLFLIPLDGERRWYRYHHLFADLLRARLQQQGQEQVRLLHRRASAWFEGEGLLEEAVQHALEAGDAARAAGLLEPAADRIWMGGRMATLRGWLARLTPTALRTRPRLLIAQAGALFYLEPARFDATEAILREAEAALRAGQTATLGATEGNAELDGLYGRIVAIRASQASWETDTGRTIALAREALDRLVHDDTMWRVVALEALGIAHAMRGEVVPARRVLADAIALTHAASGGYVALGTRMWLADVSVVGGKLRDASDLYHRGLDQATREGLERLPIAASFLIALGMWLDYEQDDLGAAATHLTEGIRLIGPQHWPWVFVDACATLARIQLLRGEGEAAAELLRRVERHAREVEIPRGWMAPRLAASMARAYLAFGRVEPAAAWGARLDGGDAGALDHIVEVQRITAARLLAAKGRHAAAVGALDELLPRAKACARWGRVIEMEALRAVALDGLGRREEALGGLGRALALAEPEGYVRRFVDEGPAMRALLVAAAQRGIARTYVATLLRALGAAEAGPSPIQRAPSHFIEPLSERERDVLRLLVAGRSAPEIADALVVAPSTVRTHLKSLYGKLDAHSRDQAVARARQLRLT